MVIDEYEAPTPPQRSEARLLADALASLHVEGDAKAALELLAEHRKRFPRGVLRLEALTAEVEALLSLGWRSQALRVLDSMVGERSPRGHDLGVLRGELRAQAGRYRDAITDFDRCASDASCGAQLEERALFGRASCHKKLGETAAARADLEAYLRRFPHSQRSEAVRRALDDKE
jgi:tetratricopeptide (TPR) repeat protein